ncbi:hypothetical protein I203_100049 [Kwoniella mangroviensis CBS 8507]|uniref:uncharacterized protein n=1 Tax=Kwoniella mangroviensis CBS 8507 TaxID=1296122 RepID=UPI00080D62A6|nr:uncharacterized protein I203_07988 [Kwoniella mangroviensis CBS 8507]OCF63007.1 hypothetical protein I203_07988 [Kwoniella mangroviensis CBS 8507]
MDLLEKAQSAYVLISLSSIPLMVLAIVPHLFPYHLSGISPTSRLTPPTISLAIWTIATCSSTILDRYVLKKGQAQDLFCSVDAILIAALTTGMVTHIPAIALYRYRSLPTPSIPNPVPPTKLRNILCLTIIYAYSLLPCVPTLSKSISRGFSSSEGLAKWWGFYCIASGDWFRTVRPLTLLAPLVLTVPITLLIFSVLYSTSGHPSPHIHPTAKHWAQASMLLLISAGIGGFVVIEQIVGWNDTWLFRGIEALSGPILALTLLFNLHTWHAYSCWIRFRRPPTTSTDNLQSNAPLLSDLQKKRSSSFYVDKLEIIPGSGPGLVTKRSVRFPPTPQQAEYIPNRQMSTKGKKGKIESLLPPPAKRKSITGTGFLKSALTNHTLTLNTEREREREKMDLGMDLERGLHPHPHSMNENHSPPIQLSPEIVVRDVPEVIIQEPTPIHFNRPNRYSSNTNASSPFQYQDLVTYYSTAPSDIERGERASSVFPYFDSVYTSTTLPYNSRGSSTLDKLRREGSTSTKGSYNSKTGLGEMIGGIGKPPLPTIRAMTISNISHVDEDDSVYSQLPASIAIPGPRPTIARHSTSPTLDNPPSETSSIYSQPSISDSYRVVPRPVHSRNTSNYSIPTKRALISTAERREDDEEEMIKFG